jgi:hypothetical protein
MYSLELSTNCSLFARRPLDDVGGLVNPDSSFFFFRVRLLSSGPVACSCALCFPCVCAYLVCVCFALFSCNFLC